MVKKIISSLFLLILFFVGFLWFLGKESSANNSLVFENFGSQVAFSIKGVNEKKVSSWEEDLLRIKGISFNNNQIIWTDYQNENGDVYSYDLNRNTERRITFSSGSKGDGKLGREHIVWIDHRNDGQDLYALDLS